MRVMPYLLQQPEEEPGVWREEHVTELCEAVPGQSSPLLVQARSGHASAKGQG